jgi:hypothetical protein
MIPRGTLCRTDLWIAATTLAASWYTPRDGKTKSGYYLKNDGIAVQAEVIKYRYTDQKVHLTMDVEHVPGKYERDAMSTLLTVTGCSEASGWFIKSKKSRSESGEYPMFQDGTIISVCGHLHDGGTIPGAWSFT